MKVLIVDSPENQALLIEALEDLGHEVISGSEQVELVEKTTQGSEEEIFRSEQAGLILLPHQPEKDYIGMVRALQALVPGALIVVIYPGTFPDKHVRDYILAGVLECWPYPSNKSKALTLVAYLGSLVKGRLLALFGKDLIRV